VQHHLETFLARAAEADTLAEGVPAWVERDFRGYLECGILAYGFARARCEECGHERLIAFSCKSRGVCPSCSARRMCEVAAHLTDHVLPQLPLRQWVLSVPKRLRPYLQHDTRVAGAVLRIFLRAIRTALRRASPGAPSGAQLGAVSFFHRFGSSLNVHPHFHLVVLDGVFSLSGASDCDARFYEASDLTPAHVHQLESTVQRRVLRLFARRGLLDEVHADDMLGWQGSGGFSVVASVRVEGEDRAGLERLVRYCARPPFALERLHTLEGSASLTSPESRLLYRSPKPDVHGRTDIVLTPLELLERLARFVPPGHPRAAWVACTATATTASSRRTRRCAPKSSRSVGPISGPSPPSPAPRPPHPA
jgi:hypothetical protein